MAETIRTRYRPPDGVEVEDLGTPGLDLAPYLMDADAVVLVDTVLSDAPPGTLRLYRKEDLLRHGTGREPVRTIPVCRSRCLHWTLRARGRRRCCWWGAFHKRQGWVRS